MNRKPISLPLLKGILRPTYSEPEIEILESRGIATYSPNSNRIYLEHRRIENGVGIEERAILDPRSRRPWFASKKFSRVKEDAKSPIYEAIEKMGKKTKRTIFRTSSSNDSFTVSALRRRGVPLTEAMIKYLKEAEAIVITEEQMLRLD